MACDGNPAQYLMRLKRSSSAAAMSSPSRSRLADAPAWYALIPRMYMSRLGDSGHEARDLGPEAHPPQHLRRQQWQARLNPHNLPENLRPPIAHLFRKSP